MSTTSRLAGALLFSTALVSPSLAFAQNNPSAPVTTPPTGENVGEPATEIAQEETEISIPGGGGEVVVVGVRDRNIAKTSNQVVSVLSSAEIARTGEGDIAGALGRVTGLSVVGSGYVYVRGLGDRYSLALLNGLPLPSPEPLRRVVPLDLFPTSVISSSLVQKSYSVNYPGEFGGGVINLTTKSIPNESFLTVGGGVSGNSETTGQFGYSYYGSDTDWTGFDNGQRDMPAALRDYLGSGQRLDEISGDAQRAIGGQLVNRYNGVTQRLSNLPVNLSASISGGTAFDIGSAQLGVIATAGYSNKWQNRETRQQRSRSADLSTLDSDFVRVSTNNRIVANALLGLGLEFGENKIRWTNLYIRDTLKEARMGLGNRPESSTFDFLQQDTGWYERQLFDSQFVGEFRPMDNLSVEVRAAYANSQREAPAEVSLEYARTGAGPYGDLFVNRLRASGIGSAEVTYSDLDEDLYTGGLDLTYRVMPELSVTVGGAYNKTDRVSSRRAFGYNASTFPEYAGLLRPDYLLAPGILDYYDVSLIDLDPGNPAFEAQLEVKAGYAKGNWQIMPELTLDAGVRYEDASQVVDPIQVFINPVASAGSTSLDNSYWLPAATLTWQAGPDLQLRASASKTIARPQFRELIYQRFYDPDTNREYQGNPFLTDSELINAEARAEWYFAPEQRFSIAGFYKHIDKPIESFVSSSDLATSFVNAPSAQLYGAEIELQKYFDLSGLGGGFSDRRIVAVGNYTYTKSELSVSPTDTIVLVGVPAGIATDYLRDGAPLTGQSDHVANVQLGLESVERLSQYTVLVNYASKRVVSRGIFATSPQPDVIENPGFQVDFVAREGYDIEGHELELKFEVRNIFGEKHEEYQKSGSNRIDVNSYDIGTTFSLSASVKL